jgi:hypothetical protein
LFNLRPGAVHDVIRCGARRPAVGFPFLRGSRSVSGISNLSSSMTRGISAGRSAVCGLVSRSRYPGIQVSCRSDVVIMTSRVDLDPLCSNGARAMCAR